jgi:hypothetical protein
MKVESLARGEKQRGIRKSGRQEMKKLCREFNSDYVLAGSIHPGEREYRSSAIKADKKFICSIIIYKSETDRFYTADIVTVGRAPLYEYFTHVTDRVYETFDEFLD